MLIIFGWGKKTEDKKEILGDYCPICGGEIIVIRMLTWFTLFFIPIIPYRKELYLYCEECDSHFGPFTKDELFLMKFRFIKKQYEEELERPLTYSEHTHLFLQHTRGELKKGNFRESDEDNDSDKGNPFLKLIGYAFIIFIIYVIFNS